MEKFHFHRCHGTVRLEWRSVLGVSIGRKRNPLGNKFSDSPVQVLIDWNGVGILVSGGPIPAQVRCSGWLWVGPRLELLLPDQPCPLRLNYAAAATSRGRRCNKKVYNVVHGLW